MNNRSYIIFTVFLFLQFGVIKTGNAQTNHLVLQDNKTDTVIYIENQNFINQVTHWSLPDYQSANSGVVTVDVWVNKKGKVVKALYNEKQSTTNDDVLIKSSLKSAKKTKFSRIENDTIRAGIITYNFKKL